MGGLLYTSRHKFRFLLKYHFRNFGDYFYGFWIFRSFPGFFFNMSWNINLKFGIYMQQVVLHVKFEFHSNRDTLTYFTAKTRSKSFICIHGLKNHIEGSDLVHTLILWVSWSLLIFVMVGYKFCFLLKYYLGNFVDYFYGFCIFRSLPGFFSTCFEISICNLVYTCSRCSYTSTSSFIPIGTLWPTLQPKIGQSHLYAFMALKII